MDLQNIHKTALKMTIVSTYLLISRINSSNKIHSMVESMKEQDPMICCLQETHFSIKDLHRLTAKEWRKDISSKW